MSTDNLTYDETYLLVEALKEAAENDPEGFQKKLVKEPRLLKIMLSGMKRLGMFKKPLPSPLNMTPEMKAKMIEYLDKSDMSDNERKIYRGCLICAFDNSNLMKLPEKKRQNVLNKIKVLHKKVIEEK
eukprot:TRINITY_DN778438_c0_g1_i1.p1 TRINITY_DN778438_c0_g1~~TRINITY_DN778438_c0_g1_i1.p1  ORF type:complete len:128 (+),score=21.52 TRINITY_DN778438_c0_g1_i1:192-575(+)